MAVVDPYMAIVAAIITFFVGVTVFFRRNRKR